MPEHLAAIVDLGANRFQRPIGVDAAQRLGSLTSNTRSWRSGTEEPKSLSLGCELLEYGTRHGMVWMRSVHTPQQDVRVEQASVHNCVSSRSE
jgi:hypothetical protein